MPSYWETYPDTRYPIKFKLLDDIVNDGRCRLDQYPGLERPRQLTLDRDEPKEFKSISRDLCILTSRGHVSWQTKRSQKDPTLEIFHTDVVKIPVIDLKARFQPRNHDWSDASYLNRYYHGGLSRIDVEKIFKDRFDLFIPLSSESTSDQWVPAVILYTVEVEQDVWQDRLAVIFDGNVEISQQSMKRRTKEYGQMLHPEVLGRLYLDLWRAKWAKGKDRTSFLEGRNDIPKKLVLEAATEGFQAETFGIPKGRGRKRRAVLRQLRTRATSLNKQNDRGNDSSTAQDLVRVSAQVSRGRLRRRERRKNGRKPKEATSDLHTNTLEERPVEMTSHTSETSGLNGKQIWRFNNGEIGIEDQNNKIPVSLSFRFDEPNRDDTTLRTLERSNSSNLQDSPNEEVFAIQNDRIPVLTVRPLHGSGRLSSPKRYHIISYCNQNADSTGTPGFPAEPVITSAWGEIEDEDMPDIEDYQIHIANLVDEVGVVDSSNWRANAFFSVIEADPLSLIARASLSSRPTVVGLDHGHYWHKFAILLYSFTNTGENRELPYSLGYGVDHNNPVLVSRDSRWGYLDVDTVTNSSKRPRWRAAWRFEISPISDKCECSLNNVVHDLNTCKHLYKEEKIVGDAAWRSRYLSDEILSDPVAYAHKPYEFLRDLEKTLHKYHPPFVPSTENKSSSTSSSSSIPGSSTKIDGVELEETPVEQIEESAASKLPETMEGGQNSENQETDLELTKDTWANKPTDEEEAEREEQQSKEAERTYELGICSLMGLGVPKGINKGIELIQKSAELGCFRAKATAYAIASAYGLVLDIPEETLRSWLSETSLQGSRIALRDLPTLFPGTYRECLALQRDTLDFQFPKTVSHTDDILSHFDFRNPSLLLSQIETFQANDMDEPGETIKAISGKTKASLNVMARLTEGNKTEPPRYFIFGSLLHLAAVFGYRDAVTALLDVGFDIDAHNALTTLRTPLLCAMNRGHADVAKVLINRGANCQPLTMWALDDMFCITPTALHYLVNIENDSKMKELARLLVKNGADVNYKCDIENLKLQTPTEIPLLKGRSVTPLGWAVIHRKPKVVRILLSLGAKFAYEEYFRPSLKSKPENKDLQRGCLLLETPCTDVDILEMFYAHARVPGLPIEFSQTPLGLLVSEDDGPERRLRLGFGDFDSIREAVDLCMELQLGYEEVLIWSAVRHDHVDVVKYLLEDLGWNVESQWRGLTNLHTAILYGRTDLVRYLVARGADVTAKTASRQLTCLHLLTLVPRHPQVDQDIFDCITTCDIEVDAREKIDGLTAFHIAVRNQKLPIAKQLLDMGADPLVPVTDQLSFLSQGKGGYLERTPDRPQLFTRSLAILGEVLLQYSQDKLYDMPYVADLLFLLLDRLPKPLSEEHLMIDKGISMNLMHILSTFPPHPGTPHIYRRDTAQTRWNDPPPIIPPLHSAPASLLQLVLLRSSPSTINARDFQGDTPLHYACASHQLKHIRTLLSAGADPTLVNNAGLNPVEVMAWSVLFLSGKTLLFHEPRKSWHPEIDFSPWYNGKKYKRGKHAASDLSISFTIFADLGLRVDEQLKRLVLAWDFARARDGDDSYAGSGTRSLEFVPVESTRGIVGDEDPDNHYKANGEYDSEWHERIKRPYMLASVKGASKWRTMFGTEEWDRQFEIDFERGAL